MPDATHAHPAVGSAGRLDVRIRHRQGALDLDVHFTLTQNWTVLFGPSGSGKTSILRAVAGLFHPQACRIEYIPATSSSAAIQPVLLADSEAGISRAAHRRHIPLAFQTPLLFPHLSVHQNIRYSAHSPSQPGDEAEIAASLIALFQLGHVADKPVSTLSGGEQQRVSVARALFSAVTLSLPDPAAPRLVLLDEPFTGLDTRLREELVALLPAWVGRWQLAVLSVTHDIAEAFQLQAEVLKLHAGRIVAQGPAHLVLAEERTRLLAHLGPRTTARLDSEDAYLGG